MATVNLEQFPHTISGTTLCCLLVVSQRDSVGRYRDYLFHNCDQFVRSYGKANSSFDVCYREFIVDEACNDLNASRIYREVVRRGAAVASLGETEPLPHRHL
jgi:hypothetical protein